MLQVHQAPSQSWWPALSALGVAAFAAYAVVSWVLQIQSISAPASVVPVVTHAKAGHASEPSDSDLNRHVASALGAAKPAASASAKGNPDQAAHQWSLLGVVAGASGKGSALLGVDGQAPKAYLPGQTVAPGWVLHSVGHRLARLAPSLQDTPTITLELPN